jgi:hypothetical protein
MKSQHLIPFLAFTSAVFGSDLKKEDVAGRRLSLQHDTKVEVYQLKETGSALAQLGVKNGPITGPVLQWKVEENRLVIADGQNARQRFEVIEKSSGQMKLRRESGEVVIFEITEVQK